MNNMNIFEKRITLFRSTTEVEVIKKYSDVTIEEVLRDIKDGKYQSAIEELRAGNKGIKETLPTAAFHGLFEYSRKKENFIEASGLIILDLDDVPIDEIEETKEEIIQDNNVVAAMTSPSGDGIKILYWVNEDLITADNYRQIGKKVVEDFEVYGNVDYLSTTDCLIVSYDPNIKINHDAEPAEVYVVESELITKAKLEERDESTPLFDDAEEFYRTALLNDIEEKTNNNYHFIQVSILDLAKFGFQHPEHDLSFVVDYSESAFKYSSENQKRFKAVCLLAKDYPQTRWPYKFYNDDDDEDDGEYDYSEYITPSSSSKETNEEDDDDEESDGLIDYDSIFDRILEKVREGDRVGKEISIETFADVCRFKGTGIFTITGIPGHGKTEFTDQCILDLWRLYAEESIIVGFEQSPEEHLVKLSRKLLGTNITHQSWFQEDDNINKLKNAVNFLTEGIKHIDTSVVGGNVNKILKHAAKLISERREAGHNPRYIVLDPFNMLSIKGRIAGHEKAEAILRELTLFSHRMGVMVLLIAHPFKMKKDEKTGEYEIPDFYSVKGSSAFFEMSYHGMTVFRTSGNSVIVRILKMKQNNMGTTGADVLLEYDRESGRYIPQDEEGNQLEGTYYDLDWFEKALEAHEEFNKIREKTIKIRNSIKKIVYL